MPDAVSSSLPLWQILLLIVFLLLALAAASQALRCLFRGQSSEEDRDWSVPPLEASKGRSFFHSWDVRCKIIALVGFSFLVVSLDHLSLAFGALTVSMVALIAARIPFSRALMRLTAVAAFVALLLVIMPVTVPVHPGDRLVVLTEKQWLVFNLRGLDLALTIGAKAMAVALLMEPLLGTAPLPITLHGLSRLGVPKLFGQMVLLSHRYLYVFQEEAGRMATGMRVRGFQRSSGLSNLRVFGSFLGMLFIRSFERTERVFSAMQARGYHGAFPEPETKTLSCIDVLLAVLWLLAGTCLVLADRLMQ